MKQKIVPELEFKANFRDILPRHRAMQTAQAGCLIYTSLEEEKSLIAAESAKIPPLEAIDFDRDPLLISRLFCDRAENLLSFRRDYPDDSIPYASPRYGSGILAGMLLGELTFGGNTSWVEPVGGSLDAVIGFKWGGENKWIDIVIDGLDYLSGRMQGKCYTFLEGYHAPLELASMLRGGELYLDMSLEPEKVHQLLRRSDEALMWLYQLIEQRVPDPNYGALATVLWMERGLPYLSDDSAGLISPAHYLEFGVPYTDKMFERYGGGFLHFHTKAYHQRDNLSAMQWLTIHNWRQDPNTREPYEVLDHILPGAKHQIVMIELSPEHIRKNIDLLAQGRFVIMTTCEDRREQHEIVELIREKTPPT